MHNTRRCAKRQTPTPTKRLLTIVLLLCVWIGARLMNGFGCIGTAVLLACIPFGPPPPPPGTPKSTDQRLKTLLLIQLSTTHSS